jgi:8-oxo-dGTP pyrophosphatase MutT (NUDIX family)
VLVSGRLGADRAEVALRHGEHPRAAALRAAVTLTAGPVRVAGLPQVGADLVCGPDGPVQTLRIGYPLRPGPPAPEPLGQNAGSAAPRDHPRDPSRDHPRDLPLVQRAAAYAVVVEAGRLLLTRLSSRQTWTLPGGGIEHGETPVQAAVREVYEETGLALRPGALLDVDSLHFTGQAPDGRWEDYHGIRVVYAGSVPGGSTPQVIEVDGSTEQAAWVSRSELARLRLTSLVRTVATTDLLARLSG